MTTAPTWRVCGSASAQSVRSPKRIRCVLLQSQAKSGGVARAARRVARAAAAVLSVPTNPDMPATTGAHPPRPEAKPLSVKMAGILSVRTAAPPRSLKLRKLTPRPLIRGAAGTFVNAGAARVARRVARAARAAAAVLSVPTKADLPATTGAHPPRTEAKPLSVKMARILSVTTAALPKDPKGLKMKTSSLRAARTSHHYLYIWPHRADN